MEMRSEHEGKPGPFARAMQHLKASYRHIVDNAAGFPQKVMKIGQDDPRRIIHSFKVGMALSLVSLFYYYAPLYSGFGVSALWAVLTVVVVFEYTVGATLGKGLNRAFATLFAGFLAVGAHHLASMLGEKAEPVIMGAFVFLIAVSSTFARFFPGVKTRYDYGVTIFILTFSLVAVAGYRVQQLLEMARQRLSTIAIGSSACVIISIFVFPVWAGEDLQDLVALNMEKVAKSLKGFEAEYLKKNEEADEIIPIAADGDGASSSLEAYKSILNSKSSEETLANFARWEPGHGNFRFRHPWNQYLKIGALARQCACSIDALNTCINSDSQQPSNFIDSLKDTCIEMTSGCSDALMELSSAIRSMTMPVAVTTPLLFAKKASMELKTSFKMTSMETPIILEIFPMVTIATLLLEIVNHVGRLSEAVHELGQMANFKNPTNMMEKPLFDRSSIKLLMDEGNSSNIP